MGTSHAGPALLALPIFRSPAQARLLSYLFLTAEGPSSLSTLSARTGIPVSTVQREIERLEQAGLVSSERVGNTRLVSANESSPYFPDLHSLLQKAFGPVPLLTSLLNETTGVMKAFIFGSWAERLRGTLGPAPRDVDLLVVGDVDPDSIYKAARAAEDVLQVEVNPVIVSNEDWKSPHGLVRRVVGGPLVELPLTDDTDDR